MVKASNISIGSSSGLTQAAAHGYGQAQASFFKSVDFFIHGAPPKPLGYNTDDLMDATQYKSISNAFANGTTPAYLNPVNNPALAAPQTSEDIWASKIGQLYSNFNSLYGGGGAYGDPNEGNYGALYTAQNNQQNYSTLSQYSNKGITNPEVYQEWSQGFQSWGTAVGAMTEAMGVFFDEGESEEAETV